MVKTVRIWLVLVLSLVLAGSNVVFLPSNSQPAAALSGAEFDPGLIISDTVFNDFGTMTVDDIQKFLNSQVKTCTDNDGGPKCLRNYKENVVGSVAIKAALHSYDLQICKEVPAAPNQTSAQIIYAVAQACGINPRVLLVTLQKEQGLVQAKNPTTYMYKAAMGYGCPDSNPAICGTDSNAQSRLFWQLYRASWQLRWYGDPRGRFTYLKPGRDISVLYHPTNNCGKKTFKLANQATAKLYYYTPYTPNQAALNNLYGNGDSCSAYGNRNFWRWYWKWFGSPVAGGFILRSNSSDYYLIINNSKFRLSSSDLLGAFGPLGAGVISQAYLDSIPTGSDLTRIIKDPAGTVYFVDGGIRFPVADCNQVASFGFSCDSALTLTQDQINLMSQGPQLTSLIPADPANPGAGRFLIENGVKREILDDASAQALGITLPALSGAGIGAFANLPWGAPIASENVLFTNRSSGKLAVISAGRVYDFAPELVRETNFAQWFATTSGSMSNEGLSNLGPITAVNTIVKDPSQQHFVLTNSGKRPVSNGAELTTSAPEVSSELLSRIPDVNAVLATPALVRVDGSKSIYLIDDAKRRLTDSADTRAKLTAVTGSPEIQSIPQSALNLISDGGPVLAPGRLLKDSKKTLWLVDGTSNLVRVPSATQANLYGLGTSSSVKASQIVGYTKNGILSTLKVKCGAQQYLAVKGKLQPIADVYAAQYPGDITQLSEVTCKYLKVGTTQLGRFVKSASNIIYLMENGKRRQIKTIKQYKALVGNTPGFYTIDVPAALQLPIGKVLPASVVSPLTAASAKLQTIDLNPAPTPSPTAVAAPLVSKAPEGSPCTLAPRADYAFKDGANWFHFVSSGDSFSGIAKYCGLTQSKLLTYNSGLVKDPNKLKLGWKIRVSNN